MRPQRKKRQWPIPDDIARTVTPICDFCKRSSEMVDDGSDRLVEVPLELKRMPDFNIVVCEQCAEKILRAQRGESDDDSYDD